MEKYPITARSLERYYHIDGDQFERQYKEHLSDYRMWGQLSHAEDWLLFPENLGPYLSIDETSLSNGELYTIITNREAHGGKGAIVAIVKGTKADDVIAVVEQIPEEALQGVKEVTLDLSESMRRIVRRCFTSAIRVIDRFHIQKLACDAVQEIRIGHRWEAIQEETDSRQEAKGLKRKYTPFTFENGDTRKELLARSRYLLFKSAEKWTESQKIRAGILFKEYPDIQLITEQHVPAEQPINDAEEITANLLTANPDKDSVTAIFAAWDEPAIGAAKALAEAGRDEVIVTGVDGNEQAVQMIKDGSCLKATVKQNFEGMADIVCRQMEKYYAGETIEKGEMYAPAELITQENAQ